MFDPIEDDFGKAGEAGVAAAQRSPAVLAARAGLGGRVHGGVSGAVSAEVVDGLLVRATVLTRTEGVAEAGSRRALDAVAFRAHDVAGEAGGAEGARVSTLETFGAVGGDLEVRLARHVLGALTGFVDEEALT